jgi:hypothetical protein
MNNTKIDYMLTGIVSGEYLEVTGHGYINEAGGYLLDIVPLKIPAGWDPGLIIMICCDNLRLISSKSIDNSINKQIQELLPLQLGTRVNSMREGTLQDKDGNYIVSMKAKGFLWMQGDTLVTRSVILDGFSHLEKFGGISEISDYKEIVTPTTAGHASGLSTYQLRTVDGTTLYGQTHYPYKFSGNGLTHSVSLSVTEINSGSAQFRESLRTKCSLSVHVKAEN